MTCAGCEAAVKIAAKKVDGVKDIAVSYDRDADRERIHDQPQESLALPQLFFGSLSIGNIDRRYQDAGLATNVDAVH
jgi:copper chaperone CopZ